MGLLFGRSWVSRFSDWVGMNLGMSAKLDGFASIMATGSTTGGSSGDGLTVAEVITLINDYAPSGTLTTAQLAAVNSVVNNDYLKVEDADDQYAPRTRSVQVTCTLSGTIPSEAALKSSFESHSVCSNLVSGQVVSAHLTGTSLRIQITCIDTNVVATETAMAQLKSSSSGIATMSAALGGVTVASLPVVSRSLLTSSGGVPLLSVVS